MATKSTSKAQTSATVQALTVALAAKEAADTARASALAAEVAANEHRAALLARLEDGDDTVTASELAAAEADIDRSSRLAAASARRADEAGIVHTHAVATHHTTEFLESSPLSVADIDGARVAAIESIRTAITALRQAIGARNTSIAEVVGAAQGAGLIAGQADPLSPLLIDGGQLLIDGEHVPVIDPDAYVRHVFAVASE